MSVDEKDDGIPGEHADLTRPVDGRAAGGIVQGTDKPLWGTPDSGHESIVPLLDRPPGGILRELADRQAQTEGADMPLVPEPEEPKSTDVDPQFPTETPNRWLQNPATRRWLYGIAAALGAALVVAGIVTNEQVDAVLNIVGAVLLIATGGLAARNTPKG